MKLNTETVPDLFQKAPKPISPKTHLWLDIATSAYFITAGAFFWTRGNKRAAAAAFVNGSAGTTEACEGSDEWIILPRVATRSGGG